MKIEKKFGRFTLGFLAVVHLFTAAACWRMNGIYTERVYSYGDAELTQLMARGYGLVAIGALLSSLLIITSLVLIKGKGQHRA